MLRHFSIHHRVCLLGYCLPEGYVSPRLQTDRSTARLIQRIPFENDVTIRVSNKKVKAKVEPSPPPAVLDQKLKNKEAGLSTGYNMNDKHHFSNKKTKKKSNLGMGF